MAMRWQLSLLHPPRARGLLFLGMLVHAGSAAGGGRYRLALLRPPPASGLCYGVVAYAVLAAFAGRAAPS
eukprot:10892271-Alexandrium_andersonii.AAC.1